MFSIIIPKNIDVNFGKNWISFKKGDIFCVKSKPLNLFLHKRENKLYCIQKINKDNILFFNCLSHFIKDFSIGFFTKLKLIGIGYKVDKYKDTLEFKLGYSHKILYKLPEKVNVFLSETKDPIIIVHGLDSQKVMKVACDIRNLKKPDIYKGKGIRFFDQNIILKEGKKTNL